MVSVPGIGKLEVLKQQRYIRLVSARGKSNVAKRARLKNVQFRHFLAKPNLTRYIYVNSGPRSRLYEALMGKVSLWRLRYGRMVKALACRVEGPGFKSHHGKKFRKKVSVIIKKKKGQLSFACMMEVRMTGVLPNS